MSVWLTPWLLVVRRRMMWRCPRKPSAGAARLAIFDYIAAFYNRTRRHSTNGFRSPEDQETQYAASRT